MPSSRSTWRSPAPHRAASSPPDTTSSPRRGCRPTAGASPGSRGTIPTCRGTAPLCISPSWMRTARSSALPRRIAGGAAESIFQPEWSPDGADLVFRLGPLRLVESLSLRRRRPVRCADGAASGRIRRSRNGCSACRPTPSPAPDRIVCAYAEGGLGRLAVIDLATGALTSIDTPFTEFASLRAARRSGRVVARRARASGEHRRA